VDKPTLKSKLTDTALLAVKQVPVLGQVVDALDQLNAIWITKDKEWEALLHREADLIANVRKMIEQDRESVEENLNSRLARSSHQLFRATP
jgi:hypothetical protein